MPIPALRLMSPKRRGSSADAMWDRHRVRAAINTRGLRISCVLTIHLLITGRSVGGLSVRSCTHDRSIPGNPGAIWEHLLPKPPHHIISDRRCSSQPFSVPDPVVCPACTRRLRRVRTRRMSLRKGRKPTRQSPTGSMLQVAAPAFGSLAIMCRSLCRISVGHLLSACERGRR